MPDLRSVRITLCSDPRTSWRDLEEALAAEPSRPLVLGGSAAIPAGYYVRDRRA
jgi:hypothetical protein